MAAACPIALIRVDEHQARVHALLVALTAALFVWSVSAGVLALLAYDFCVRVLFSAKASPLFHLSRAIAAQLPLAAHPVDAGPKKFAAKIGLLLVMAALLGIAGGYTVLSLWLMSLLALFAGLEAFCGFCIGCKLYALLAPLFARLHSSV